MSSRQTFRCCHMNFLSEFFVSILPSYSLVFSFFFCSLFFLPVVFSAYNRFLCLKDFFFNPLVFQTLWFLSQRFLQHHHYLLPFHIFLPYSDFSLLKILSPLLLLASIVMSPFFINGALVTVVTLHFYCFRTCDLTLSPYRQHEDALYTVISATNKQTDRHCFILIIKAFATLFINAITSLSC